MRQFNDREKSIINKILEANDSNYILVNEFLQELYFTEQSKRALILQAHGHYAVFFMTPEIFDDAEKNREEVKLFFELISLLNYLNINGYLTIYRKKTEMLYFFQETFTDVKASHNSIVLNDKGDYTFSPDTIHDKNKNIIYKGIIFNADVFELILKTTTGVMVISDSFGDLLADEKNPQIIIERAKDKMLRIHRIGLWITVFSFVILVVMAYLVYDKTNKNDEYLKQISKKDTFPLNNIKDSLTKKKDGIQEKKVIPNTTKDSLEYLYGVDISKWNGNAATQIEPNDSISFIICKATEGLSYIDSEFHDNWKIIRDKKYILGAYHFYNTYEDPIKQGQHYWTTISIKGKTDMVPIVDIEELSLPKKGKNKPDQIQNDLIKFLNYIEAISGRIPIIYTAPSFANKYLGNVLFSKYQLWIAEYTSAKKPKIPFAWKEKGYKIWQKSDNYFIDSNASDFDVFYGKKSDLYK